MTGTIDTSDSTERAARLTFQRRRRIAFVVLTLVGLTHLLRYPPLAAQAPIPLDWVGSVWLWSPFVVAAVLIWIFRCPVCRGGLRLDGRTCASCGRVFGARP